ncbi:hypothetical protein ACFQO4_19800 [Saliphagus sp. GCM10025334]|uniref:hypothetical protein n=1 Tax=Natronosalvus caseinilyticus TaxID=2953747 RepID=UPI0028B1F232|nr:hypothetical protein [Natronosalvus caseinilyticus]
MAYAIMISRRELIGISGSALVSSTLAGCLSDSDTVSADLLQIKAITVRWRHENHSYSDHILRLFSDGESEITGLVATEYGNVVSSPVEVTVSDEFHETLEGEFETVRYAIGVCGDGFSSDADNHGCLNAPTSREDFNSVQFGDQSEVEVADNHNHIDVQDVKRGDVEDWDTDISEFEWSERHAEHGQ